MYDNFDDDNWSRSGRRSGGSQGGLDTNQILLILCIVLFVFMSVGGVSYYLYYLQTEGTQTVQNQPAADAQAVAVTSTPKPSATPTPTPVDPEYAEITADMTDEEKADYDAMLEFTARYKAANLTYPITQTVYREPKVYADTLVFILSFNNQPLITDSALWSDYFFGNGYYGTGSVSGYYKEVSHGTIAVRPAKESQGTANDGVIRLDMDRSHPGFSGAFYSSPDVNATLNTIHSFIKSVMTKSNQYIDYSDYDKNGDGIVGSEELDIIMIFAGYEDAYLPGLIPNATYSAQVWLSNLTINLDGVAMNEAILTAELSPAIDSNVPIAPMGAICHEMGHAIGLPDEYDTDYSSEGLAFHSLMAGGSYNFYGGEIGSLPPPLMAWDLLRLGAMEPEVVETSGTYEVWCRSNENYNILKIPAQDGYYLIENVDFGGYGQGLSLYVLEPGIAIWYIDEDVINSRYAEYTYSVNDDEYRPGVRLVEPYGATDLLHGNFDYMKVYDHYFRLSGDSKYTGSCGVIVEILDDPGDVMRVNITLVQ